MKNVKTKKDYKDKDYEAREQERFWAESLNEDPDFSDFDYDNIKDLI